LKFESITINDGLSQGMINYILQDHFGFMWFASKDGLNRYDGYRFVIYRHDASDSTTLADNYVTCLFEDSKGNLWVGTAGHGLDMFERGTETFFHFTHGDKNSNSITDNHISKVAEDNFGNLWVGTSSGLNKISITPVKSAAPTLPFTNRNEIKINHIHLDPSRPGFELFTRKKGYDMGLNTFHIDQSGMIWVSTYGMLFTIRPSENANDKIEQLDISKYFTYPHEDKGMETNVQGYAEDSLNKKLYFISSFCITEINLTKSSSKFISDRRYYDGFIGWQTQVDGNGIIWISNSERLLNFNPGTREVTEVYPKDITQEDMLHSVSLIYEDRSGVMWLGTKGYGLLKYNSQSARFHHTDIGSTRWISALNDSLVAVVKTKDYIHVFNTHTGVYSDTLPGPVFKNEKNYTGFGYADAVVMDADGSYWISKGRLIHLDRDKKNIFEYNVPQYTCFPVFLDHKNNVWAGTENAFSRFDKESKKFIDYNYPVATFRTPYQFLAAVYEDEKGVFWLGTLDGMFRLDVASGLWEHYKNSISDTASLSFDLVLCICPDPKEPGKYLWVGTNGGGLNRFDKSTGKFVRITEKDGLPNDVVYGMLNNGNGTLWISTNKGLSCFSPSSKTFKNYEMEDGLQSNEFNRYSFCKTADGILFFGGMNGFNYFKPGELKSNPFIPNVVITEVLIKNHPVNFKIKGAAFDMPAYLTDAFSLPYKDNVISFEFASLEFSSPDKNVYQYMLEGFDKEWNYAGNKHNATYTNLDPGKYTFRVKGSNNDGVWNEKATAVILTILPPWYMTWWFRTLAAAAIAGSVYLIYRYRLRQALNLQMVRNRIAQDLHDEVGSNLSSISIFTDMATSKSVKNEDVKSLLNKINDYTRTSMEAMSDIVWMINSGNDRFENIIIHMRELAAELFEAKNYLLHLNFDEQLNSLKLGMDERKNFYLIYKEALNNIVKYADGKNVWIEMDMNHSSVHLKIKDDGIGFDMHKATHGNGLINMQKRTEVLKGDLKIDSSPGNGTTLTLKFSL